jgi:hypothetical protein
MLSDLLRARERMRLLPSSERVVLEVALLELCRAESGVSLAELEARLLEFERRLASGAPAPPASRGSSSAPPLPARATSPPARATSPPARVPAEAATPPPRDPDPSDTPRASAPAAGPTEAWPRLLTALEDRHASLADLLRRHGSLAATPEGAEIRLGKLEEPDASLVGDKRNRKAIERALSAIVGRELAVQIQIGAAGESRRTPEAPAAAPPDPFTTKVAELFEGRVEEA